MKRSILEKKNSPSSSFIKPPANGHHRWSGAEKKHILIIFYNFLQFFTILAWVISSETK
jgi:hypothetical protein